MYRLDAQGWQWPATDRECSAVVPRQVVDMDVALQHVPMERRRVAVQAGGNVGMWPVRMARYFDEVYTFEPEALNFECLMRNLEEKGGEGGAIHVSSAAVGTASGRAGMLRKPQNVGAHKMVEGDEVDVVALDDVIPPDADVSYLQLDVEGWEWEALLGAEALLARCRPVVQLELKGLGRPRYEDREVVEWLEHRGFPKVTTVHRDVIFVGGAT